MIRTASPASLLHPVVICIALALPACAAPSEKPQPDFSTDRLRWAVEQMPAGSVDIKQGVIEITDAAGCTLWLREKLTAPVEITYEVTVVVAGGPRDRLSDLNCFWMANDSRPPSDAPPFAPDHARTGKFSDYNSLLTYYVGYGGNNNSTTRFRRYDGNAERPLLPEHDLGGSPVLLQPNHPYRIKLVARDGVAEFWRDGEKIFSFRDPSPLTSGWFAFRTVRSHLVIRNFRVTTPERGAPSGPIPSSLRPAGILP